MKRVKYCFDTHPLVWYFTGQPTLSQTAKHALDHVFTKKAIGYISVMVLLEVFHLSLKKKELDFPKFLRQLRIPTLVLMPIEKKIMLTSFRLPKQFEIHDRVIVATASVTKSILVTKDPALRNSKTVKTLW